MLGLVLLNLHRLGLYQFSWVFFFTITLLYYACLKTRCCWQGNEFVFEQYKASFCLWCHGSNNLVDDVGCRFYCIPSFLLHMVILKNICLLYETLDIWRGQAYLSVYLPCLFECCLFLAHFIALPLESVDSLFARGATFLSSCEFLFNIWIRPKRSRHPTV